MESWIRILFLNLLLITSCISYAAEQTGKQGNQSLDQVIESEPLIHPEIPRRAVVEALIDTENFELGFFVGLLSIEDFSVNPIYGIRLDYHVTEDLFIEATIGQSEAGKTSADNFLGGATVLTSDQKEYFYYNVAVGYNILPSEAFMGGQKAFNTALYVIAGAGSTDFAGDDRFTIIAGAGYRISLKDWLTMHLNFRDHIFSIDVTGDEKDSHNFEVSVGFNYVF